MFYFMFYFTCESLLYIPPEFPERLAELGVVQLRVLIGEFPTSSLRPDHERVHRPLDVRLSLVPVGPGTTHDALAAGPARGRADRHRDQRPVVAAEHLADRLLDLLRELVDRGRRRGGGRLAARSADHHQSLRGGTVADRGWRDGAETHRSRQRRSGLRRRTFHGGTGCRPG